MPFLQRSDYAIHYTIEGPERAPLLLLSNSLGADIAMWDLQAAEFAKAFRVLRYDNRGHGGSSAPAGPYSLEDVASDALLLLSEVGAQKAHFCGLSLGGMVGMWLATHHPARLGKLVLCNTAAWMGPPENWTQRIAAVKENGMQSIAEGVMERWFTKVFREASPEVVAAVESRFVKVGVDGYAGCCAAIRDMDQRASLSQIGGEVLVVAGTYDPATPPEVGMAIMEAVNGSRYVELPAAHLSNIEAAGLFNDVVGHFLAG